MLGRKTYTAEELDRARAAVDARLKAYRRLADAVTRADDPEVVEALAAAEPLLFEAMLLALDRPFVHRVRPVTGKDTNPLTELELLVESLVDHDGVLTTNKVIRYVPARATLGLDPGERIRLSAEQFQALADAVLADLGTRFAES